MNIEIKRVVYGRKAFKMQSMIHGGTITNTVFLPRKPLSTRLTNALAFTQSVAMAGVMGGIAAGGKLNAFQYVVLFLAWVVVLGGSWALIKAVNELDFLRVKFKMRTGEDA